MPADKSTPHTRAKATLPPEPDYIKYINQKLEQQASDNNRRFKIQHDQLLDLQQQNNNVLTESQNIILENKKLQGKMQQLLAENESVKEELAEARALIQKLQQAMDQQQQQQQQQYPLYDDDDITSKDGMDYHDDHYGLGHSHHAPSKKEMPAMEEKVRQ